MDAAKHFYCKKRTFCLAIILQCTIAFSGLIWAQSEQNAANLYYKAFMLYPEPDNETSAVLGNYVSGEINLVKKYKNYFEEHKDAIDLVIDAAKFKYCNWGYDYTEQQEFIKECLINCSAAKRISILLLAQTRTCLENNDYRKAFELCEAVYKLGGRVADRALISWFVYIGVGTMTNDIVTEIIQEIPVDENLNLISNIKYTLWHFGQRDDAFFESYDFETEWVLDCLIDTDTLRARVGEISMLLDPNDIPELSNDYLEGSRRYYIEYRRKIREKFNMPYLKGHEELNKLWKQLRADCKIPNPGELRMQDPEKLIKEWKKNIKARFQDSEAYITLFTNIRKEYTYSMRTQNRTALNALRTAIEIFTVRAQTGSLPDSLPLGLPKDLFSSKDFIYEKIEDGFILRCQGKDLIKDEIHEYQFKVAE